MAYPTAKCVHQIGNRGPKIPHRISPKTYNCSRCIPAEENKLCPRFSPITVFVFEAKEAPQEEVSRKAP